MECGRQRACTTRRWWWPYQVGHRGSVSLWATRYYYINTLCPISTESYNSVKGSLPDLRHECCCSRRSYHHHGQPVHCIGSTESLLDDSDVFLRRSANNVATHVDFSSPASRIGSSNLGVVAKQQQQQSRRCSENDIGRSECLVGGNFVIRSVTFPSLNLSIQVTRPPSRISRSCQRAPVA